MKAVALFVVYFGYAITAYGIDHITGHCTPFACVIWPSNASKCNGGSSVPCSASSSSTTGTSSAQAPTSVNAAAGAAS